MKILKIAADLIYLYALLMTLAYLIIATVFYIVYGTSMYCFQEFYKNHYKNIQYIREISVCQTNFNIKTLLFGTLNGIIYYAMPLAMFIYALEKSEIMN